MNIAIIIGVSKYSEAKNNLPGCKNDAKAIHDVIQRTDKFTPILYINEEETSAKTKELITNFVLEHKGKQVDELFFYYSGHGEFVNDEFFYILSDFDTKKRKQTSLQNSEIDDLIRTLSPQLVVKVIDACQSGTTYIKESNVISKYFTDTKKGFQKCYFLNSSLNNQSSYQDELISFFTQSFIKSIKEHSTDEIRYKDIVDFISDEFETNSEQTPFFVIQADYTEKFCVLSKGMKEFLASFNPSITKGIDAKSKPSTIAELVRLDASEYVDKAGAIKTVELVQKEVLTFKLDADIAELFKIDMKFLEDYQSVSKRSAIGTWIKENPNIYFAVPTYEKIDTTPNQFIGLGGIQTYNPLRASLFVEDPKNYRYEINGFEQKIEVPFKTISIDIIGNYPNVTNYNCIIVFLLSKKYIRFFFFITNYIEENWENRKLNTKDIEWITSEQKITDASAISDGIKKMNERFQIRIKNDLQEKFKVITTAEHENKT